MTPSIRRDVEERLPRLFDQTRLKVVRALERHAEPEAAARVPRSCPWTLDELLTAPVEDRSG